MSFRIHTAALAFMLASAAAAADSTIRFTDEGGKKRAEFKLNGNIECILQNDRITCTPASK